jgi:hypothetical protein
MPDQSLFVPAAPSAESLIQRNAGTLKLRPDQKIVYLRNWENEKTRLASVAKLLQGLVKIARSHQTRVRCPPATADAGTGQTAGGPAGLSARQPFTHTGRLNGDKASLLHDEPH